MPWNSTDGHSGNKPPTLITTGVQYYSMEAQNTTGELDETIKTRFTSNFRNTMVDLLSDEARSLDGGEQTHAQNALETLQRQKTNIVVETKTEAKAITNELETHADWIEQGHPVHTAATAKACRKAATEIKDGI